MIVMAALIWPAVRDVRNGGDKTRRSGLFGSQHAVMDMSEKDAEYFLTTLDLEGAEKRSREELRQGKGRHARRRTKGKKAKRISRQAMMPAGCFLGMYAAALQRET